MKTARFSDVVDQCGQPENHLLLTAPAQDRTLQAAIKQQRVLTVHREHVGTRKDYGTVGFEPQPHAQFLIFPRSLKAFAARRIIGIRYELLAEDTGPKPRRASPRTPAPSEPARPAPARESLPSRRSPPRKPVPPARPPTPAPAPAPRPDVSKASPRAPVSAIPADALTPLVHAIESALEELEAGKAVAAYKRLQTALAAAQRPANRD